jgi:hypothetical protein
MLRSIIMLLASLIRRIRLVLHLPIAAPVARPVPVRAPSRPRPTHR